MNTKETKNKRNFKIEASMQTANLFLMEFQSLCADFDIDPSIALENENVRQAIKTRSWDAIREALEMEF